MMIIFERFYLYSLLILMVLSALLIFKPIIFVFMVAGTLISYGGYWLIKHPAYGQLLARVLAECLGLMLMLAIFVSLMVLYGQLIRV